MTKRTIEIDDTLENCVDSVCDELRDRFESFCKENPDTDPRESGRRSSYEPHDDIAEIADSATPVYTSKIDGLWYLYSDRFENAFEDAGLYGKGDKPDNYQAVAICMYIESELWQEYERLKDELGDLYDERIATEDEQQAKQDDNDPTKAEEGE